MMKSTELEGATSGTTKALSDLVKNCSFMYESWEQVLEDQFFHMNFNEVARDEAFKWLNLCDQATAEDTNVMFQDVMQDYAMPAL